MGGKKRQFRSQVIFLERAEIHELSAERKKKELRTETPSKFFVVPLGNDASTHAAAARFHAATKASSDCAAAGVKDSRSIHPPRGLGNPVSCFQQSESYSELVAWSGAGGGPGGVYLRLTGEGHAADGEAAKHTLQAHHIDLP